MRYTRLCIPRYTMSENVKKMLRLILLSFEKTQDTLENVVLDILCQAQKIRWSQMEYPGSFSPLQTIVSVSN